jgi:hemolysin D
VNKLPAPIDRPLRKTPLPRYRERELVELVSAFESESMDLIARSTPRAQRPVLYIVMTMLVLAVVLCAFVKLDRVVVGRGTVQPVDGQIYVSPLNAGVVRSVLVKVGDRVVKGQPLAELDPTLTRADVAQLQQRLDSDAAQVERLDAEHSDRPYEPASPNPFAAVQREIWLQRQSELRSSLANFDAQIASAVALLTQHRRDAEQYKKRLDLAADVLHMYEPLVKRGYVSRQQYLGARDSHEEMSRLYSEAQNQITAQAEIVESVRAQKAGFVQKWRSDAGAQLVTTRDDYNATRENLQKAQKLLDMSVLTSPAEAIVVKVGKISTGSVAQTTNFSDPSSAGALFTLAPVDAALEAQVRVPAQDVGFIRVGDRVNLKVDAYSFVRHGLAHGTVKSISEASFTTDENNQPVPTYFKVVVAITEVKLRGVPDDFRLIPGMTVSGDVLVGSRTILSYLTEGAMRTGSEAMREAE